MDPAAIDLNRRRCAAWMARCGAVPLAACALRPAAPPARVGLLFPDGAEAHEAQLERFQARLRALGLEPGRDVVLDARYAGGGADLDGPAQMLAASGATVFIGITLGPTMALVRATAGSSAPLLFVAIGDPVARGLVADLRAPGGRITGSSDLLPGIAGERMSLLAQLLPPGSTVAWISNAAITPRAPIDAAAAAHGLGVVHADVRQAADFGRAFDVLQRAKPDAVFVTPNGVTFAERRRLAGWARARRLPVMAGWRDFMDAGVLLCAGADTAQLYDVAAEQLAAVLRGTVPGRIAVAAPRLDLVVDLRVARDLDLRVPPAILSRAHLVLG